jgi:hypothetical protein
MAATHRSSLKRAFAFCCQDCGSGAGYRSRARTFSEHYVLPLLLLRPVRCGECYRRDYRFLFTRVRSRLPEVKNSPVREQRASNVA